jgi:aryl-alcohol dehydrogenase-like predicted oxidoreductase
MEQPMYHLFHREKFEKELLPLFTDHGLGSTTFCPLAMGVLTGKYAAGIPKGSRFSLSGYEWLRARLGSNEGKDQIEKTRQLQTLAQEAGLSVHHLALLWCLQNPHVSSVILGASHIDQLRDNLQALQHAGKMTAELMQKIEAIVDNKPEPFSRF